MKARNTPTRIIFLFLITIQAQVMSGCSHMTMLYEARVKTAKKGFAEIEYRKSYGTGLEWVCGLTFWIYGGGCWAYLAKPTDGDRAQVRLDGRKELSALIDGHFDVLEENVTRIDWERRPTYRDFSYDTASSHSTSPPVANAPVSPEEFEKTILEKPDPKESAEKSAFPTGWPEKWFYETQDYRYWTIVGESAPNAASAMIHSKSKADEVIRSEFPNARKPIRYETTHNEIKTIRGKFESWRIIRVRQSDVPRD